MGRNAKLTRNALYRQQKQAAKKGTFVKDVTFTKRQERHRIKKHKKKAVTTANSKQS